MRGIAKTGSVTHLVKLLSLKGVVVSEPSQVPPATATSPRTAPPGPEPD